MVLSERAVTMLDADGGERGSELVSNVLDDAVDVESRSVASNDATFVVDEKFDEIPLDGRSGFARHLREDWIVQRGERLEEDVERVGEIAS